MDRNNSTSKNKAKSEQRNFVVQEDAWIDDALKKQTVGLVRLEDFQRIKSEIAEKKNQSTEAGKIKSRCVLDRWQFEQISQI